MEKVRVLRILEYVGSREWVEKTLERSSVPINGSRVVPSFNGDESCMIRSAMIGDFPEIMEVKEEEDAKHD